MHNAIKIPLIIFAAVLVIILFFAGAGALYYYSTKELPVTAADKALIVGPQTIQPYFDDYAPVLQAIKYKKVRYLDGQVELSMEYDVDDEDQPYMSVVVTDSPKKSDTMSNYLIAWNTMVAVFNAYDSKYEIVEKNEAFSMGDRSRYAVIQYDDAIVGNMLVFTLGNKLYELTITGYYINDGDIWRELFADKTEQLTAFNK
jgi:hypothetical protein